MPVANGDEVLRFAQDDERRGTRSMPPIIKRVANSVAATGSTGSRATMTIEISKATPARVGCSALNRGRAAC